MRAKVLIFLIINKFVFKTQKPASNNAQRGIIFLTKAFVLYSITINHTTVMKPLPALQLALLLTLQCLQASNAHRHFRRAEFLRRRK
ncbi:hypothetical protein A8C56_16890 [Niabella ginsenosidivorans]|uniref:Uncharacterized protein n=1 Tax=Niabella ginsenosidivorans TaxID=1176587 RepID=A0A1A9I6V0_9BACT|nr:hypothetical protein A8C56_16890 [Niabella ginsenosidivorans]